MVFLILLSLFLALPISGLVWEFTPLPKLVQFPWRFLALTAFALAVFAGRLPKKAGIIIAFFIILFAIPFLKLDRTFRPESYYTTNDDTTTVKNEYMPKGVKSDPLKKGDGHRWVYFPGVQGVPDENGFVTGEKLIFQETPLRLLADLISLAGIILIVCLKKTY